MTIKIITGDITELNCDAIVNAANSNLLAGGGVCGAIHNAAGQSLERVCKEIGGCETGDAVITRGFDLKAKFVIHAVGPRWWDGTRNEAELLKNCYKRIFEIVRDNNIKSVAIPAISTGIYRFPLEQATEIAIKIAQENDSENLEIIFTCFGDDVAEVYKNTLNK